MLIEQMQIMTNEDNIKQEEQVDMHDAAHDEGQAQKTTDEATDEAEEPVDEMTELKNKIESLEKELENSKKEYLFLMAEFDNFRKRTLKEKSEIIKNGAENAMRELLPVIDDFERAIKAIDDNNEIDSLKEGVDLIYKKFMKYLEKNGVKPIDSNDKDFDTELHEAVTTFPAADESKKGKIVDTIQKGYTLNDKVLRHAKVVVGQ